MAGRNHFSVLEELVDPAGRAHALALQMLGLPVARATARPVAIAR
jgi:predicted MFS family arabinose efflux permease